MTSSVPGRAARGSTSASNAGDPSPISSVEKEGSVNHREKPHRELSTEVENVDTPDPHRELLSHLPFWSENMVNYDQTIAQQIVSDIEEGLKIQYTGPKQFLIGKN